MKLAAIYNVWDGEELLQRSISCIKEHVDLIIIVWQKVSNFGEDYTPQWGTMPIDTVDSAEFKTNGNTAKVIFKKFSPKIGEGAENETQKRNIGLGIARDEGASHFFFIDCDEMYDDFKNSKQKYKDSGAKGSVCRLFTYWGKPTYQLTPIEPYWVPFIHELKADTIAGMQEYPFWVDPTRRVNEQNVVEIPSMMHHFSYVRRDIERKIRNSSAKHNLEKSSYLKDYNDLMQMENADGHLLPGINLKIKIVDNLFNIPTFSPKQDQQILSK